VSSVISLQVVTTMQYISSPFLTRLLIKISKKSVTLASKKYDLCVLFVFVVRDWIHCFPFHTTFI
jgi:hypothetical protein